MRRGALGILLAGAVWMVVAVPVSAHHAISAEFDESKPITFTGKITKVEWMNPHIYTHVETEDGVVYRVEGGPPNSLFRQGWRKEDLKVGLVVTVEGIRAKIPQSMNIGRATIRTEDGRQLLGRGGNPDRAAR